MGGSVRKAAGVGAEYPTPEAFDLQWVLVQLKVIFSNFFLSTGGSISTIEERVMPPTHPPSR